MFESIVIIWLVSVTTLVVGADNIAENEDIGDGSQYYVSNNMTNCTNDYCISDEDYFEMMVNHIFPDFSDWLLISLHSVVFVVGLVGNALVCMAVYRNHSMRTVTNYFIVNLAVADLLVILICLPSSVLWDVTETWFLGMRLCKAVPYLQTVSVSVSVLTLTFISIDRWYAICFPLRFKSTTGRAKTAIIVIWIISLLVDVPDLLVLETVPPKHKINTILFTRCDSSWSKENQITFTIVKLILLYTAPLSLMSVAYWQIVRVLWRSDIPGHNLSARVCHMNEIPPPGSGNPEGQLRSRRKAAKMLVAVVLTFALCYFPVHMLNILRYAIKIPSNQWTNAVSLISHWLCYFNSAVNPLIYNFMSASSYSTLTDDEAGVLGEKILEHNFASGRHDRDESRRDQNSLIGIWHLRNRLLLGKVSKGVQAYLPLSRKERFPSQDYIYGWRVTSGWSTFSHRHEIYSYYYKQ